MAIRVDFLGAPGVGKSTLYDRLINQYGRQYGLVSEFQARIKAAKKFTYQLDKKEGLLSRIILSAPKLRNPYIINIEEKICIKHLREYVDVNDKLLDVVHNSFCNSEKDNYGRQYGYLSFISKIKIFCSLNYYFDGLVLSDESLSQKIYGIRPSDELDEEVVIKYFENISVPKLLIFCHTDAETIVGRIKEREKKTGKLIPAHRDKSRKEVLEITGNSLRVAEVGTGVLRRRGVRVIMLNAKNDVEQNVNMVLEALKEIQRGNRIIDK